MKLFCEIIICLFFLIIPVFTENVLTGESNVSEKIDPINDYYRNLEVLERLIRVCKKQDNPEKVRYYLIQTGNLLEEMDQLTKDPEIKKGLSIQKEEIILEIGESWFVEENGKKGFDFLEQAIKDKKVTGDRILECYYQMASWMESQNEFEQAEKILLKIYLLNQEKIQKQSQNYNKETSR